MNISDTEYCAARVYSLSFRLMIRYLSFILVNSISVAFTIELFLFAINDSQHEAVGSFIMMPGTNKIDQSVDLMAFNRNNNYRREPPCRILSRIRSGNDG